MRLFLAVDVGPDVQQEAARLIGELRRRLDRSAPRARITWVDPERMHVTLRFLGRVGEVAAEQLRRLLEMPFSTPAFDLAITGAGAFPPTRAPRVLWAGIGAGMASMQALERELSDRLAPLAFPEEERAFQPHLTLGRVKSGAGIRPRALLDGLADISLGVAPVRAVTLFESRLSPKGPAYVALFRTPLHHA